MNCKRRRNKVLVLTICIILLLSLLFVTMLANFCYIDKEADAVTNYGNTTHIGKLTLDNYESNSNGKVFDSDKLSALYNALLGNNKKTLADVNAELLNGNINSANFRVNNSGKNDVVVEIGGMNWAAVYLSKNRNNEPILTLWLASSNEIKDANYRTAQWNTYASTTKGDYPGNMYATSKLRAVGLNNGGKYATSPTAFDGVAVQDKDSPFAIFTMPNSMAAGKEVSGSLIDFIDAPQNVEWQEFEEGVGIDRVDCNYENDAYSKTVTGFNTRYRSDNMTTCANYSDWQTDTLWIPSIAEMGYGSYGNGMWQRSSELYSDANSYWLRSASYTNYKDAMYQTGAGCSSNSSYSVRPAFHLNLAKADSASLALLDLPKNATMEYTSERIGVHSLSTLPTWYKSSVYDSSTLMTTIYKNSAGSAVSGGLPKDEGEYTVEFTLTATGKNKYCWKDSATNKSDTRSITFKITLKPIKYTLSGGGVSLPKVEHDVSNLGVNDTKLAQGTVLGFRYTGLYGSSYDDTKLPTVNGTYRATVISLNHNYTPDLSISPNYKDFTVEGARANVPTFNTVSQGYDGGNAVSFVLNGFDSAQMEVVMPLPSGVNYNGGEIITANRAGKYKIKIALKNKDGSIYWNSLEGSEDMADKELEFEITPAQISVMIDPDSGSNDTIKVVRGEKTKVSGMILQQPLMAVNSDTTNLHFWADFGSSKYELGYTDASGNKVMTGYPIDKNSGTVTLSDLELHTDVLPMNVKWTLRIESSNGDYVAVLDSDIYLQVEAKVVMADPTWILKRNSARVDTQSVVLGDTTPIVYSKTLAYNDRNTYEFQMLAPGYTVSDYQVVANKGASNTAIGKNADTYTTSVKLTDKNNNEVIYSITWTIDPVKFDLSQVKWLNNGQLPYDKVNGSKAELDPKTLPAGLIPTVINNTGTTVGTSGSASVTFALDSAYVGNYIVPNENDNTSYIDPNGDFEWSKTWTIVPAQIQSSSWKNESYTDTNGKAFDIPVLRDPNADGGIVEYEYYECDSTGNIINNTPIAVKDIIWSESDAKYYIAKPILQDVNNYTLDDPSAQSKVFRVGKDLTKVSITLEKDKVEYNTNPRHATVKVTDSALPNTAFELTYYDGYTRLTTAPTEVGKYTVEVSLKSSYIDKYQIDGKNEFDYEIVRAQIAIDWNDNIKPPTLKLTYGQINGVEYEIVDKDENVVSYNDLKAGETYKIRAKIKDSQLNHFVFVGNKTETEWHEFSVSDNDQLYDPNSPSNPSYPQTDPDLPKQDPSNPDDNNPGSGDIGSGDNPGGSFGDILEKLKDMPLWQLIASVISIILTIIFLSKTASYDSKRKKFNKKADKLDTSMYAGAFLGVAMSIWTAIACVLIGLAVVSLVMMLIAKSRCNKAEENYEESLEEYNRNQRDLEERKRAAEKEDMKMMFMSMMGGNANGGMAQGMPQGGYMGGYGIGIDDMRGLITETVTALLPGMQQLLPQQASTNDEVMKSLVEEQKAMREVMQKLADQPVERIVEKEVSASGVVNEDVIRQLIDKNDERFEQMMKTQEALIAKILEKDNAPQVIEKEVPVEKIVEKVVEVPVEVEKVVEKEVKVKVTAPAKPKIEKAPRLTLDEAYALLSKEQKKYFDGLRDYALTKYKCKEKKSTYFVVYGQTSTNPLVKLTIKKDITVALLKMEDEYMKDIRRDATGDGTKVRVKETEVVVSDKQAFETAKKMIDLRDDQIERYQELLREQRSMRSKK